MLIVEPVGGGDHNVGDQSLHVPVVDFNQAGFSHHINDGTAGIGFFIQNAVKFLLQFLYQHFYFWKMLSSISTHNPIKFLRGAIQRKTS